MHGLAVENVSAGEYATAVAFIEAGLELQVSWAKLASGRLRPPLSDINIDRGHRLPYLRNVRWT